MEIEIEVTIDKEQVRQDGDRVVELLWDMFADVPMNPASECIEEDYLDFPKGTHREEIWHWFDEAHSKGAYYLLYERKAQYRLTKKGHPVYRNRAKHYEQFTPVKEEDGVTLYRRELRAMDWNPTPYCSECGKVLSSHFTEYCPHCGTEIDMEKSTRGEP